MGHKNFKNSNKMIWNMDFKHFYMPWDIPQGSRKLRQLARQLNTLWFWSYLVLWVTVNNHLHGGWGRGWVEKMLRVSPSLRDGRWGHYAPPTDRHLGACGEDGFSPDLLRSRCPGGIWVEKATGACPVGISNSACPTLSFPFSHQTLSLSIKQTMVKSPIFPKY